jgi:hypothetical protein
MFCLNALSVKLSNVIQRWAYASFAVKVIGTRREIISVQPWNPRRRALVASGLLGVKEVAERAIKGEIHL